MKRDSNPAMEQPDTDRHAADPPSLLSAAEARLVDAQADEQERTRVFFRCKQHYEVAQADRTTDQATLALLQQTLARATLELERAHTATYEAQRALSAAHEQQRPLALKIRYETQAVRDCHARMASATRDYQIAEQDLAAHQAELQQAERALENLTGSDETLGQAQPAGQLEARGGA